MRLGVIDKNNIMYKLVISVPKNCGNKSSIGGPNHKAGDEETTGDASTVRPTGDKEVHQKDDPEGGQGEGTYIIERHTSIM